MSAIILTAVGVGVGGPAGAALGVIAGTLGAFADSRYIFPALFGVPEIVGGKLGDRKLQVASEGSPINYLLGPENRCAGTVIWKTDLIEQRIVTETGGGGGKGGGSPGANVVTYEYSVDVAIAVCEGEISKVGRIWANGKLLYDVLPVATIEADDITATALANPPGHSNPNTLILSAPEGGTDLTQLKPYYVGNMTGWAAEANNRNFIVNKTEQLGIDGTLAYLSAHQFPSTWLSEAPGNTIGITQDQSAQFGRGKYEGVEIHTGGAEQAVDSLIEAAEEAGTTPAFRNIAYVVFDGLKLADFGNTLPQFSFEVQGEGGGQYITSEVDYLNDNILTNSRTMVDWTDGSGGGGSYATITEAAAYNHNAKREDAVRLQLVRLGGGVARVQSPNLVINPDVSAPRMQMVTFWARLAVGTAASMRVIFGATHSANVSLTAAWQKFQLTTPIASSSTPWLQFGSYAAFANDANINVYISDMRYETDPEGSEVFGDEDEYTADIDGTFTNVELPSALLTIEDHIGEHVVMGSDSYPIVANGLGWARVTGDAVGDGHARGSALTLGPRNGVTTVAFALGQVLERAGCVSAQYDTSGVIGNLRGVLVVGPSALDGLLRALLFAYDVVVQERDGVLYFKTRSTLTADTVPATALVAHAPGEDVPRIAEFEDLPLVELPSEIKITYVDADADSQAGEQSARLGLPEANNVATLSLPLTLSPDEASAIALRALYSAWSNRRAIRLQLPPSYAWVREADLLTATLEGESYTVLVTRAARGNNGLILVDSVVEETAALTQTGTGATRGEVNEEFYLPPALTLEMMDLPALNDEATQVAGFYAALCASDPAAEFTAGVLFDSIGDSTYSMIRAITVETVMGRCDTTLADGIIGSWDTINTLEVTLDHGTLESRTALEVLNGLNFALVGAEVIGFQTATLVTGTTYTLSNLIRGMRGSEGFAGSHAAAEAFVFLNSAGLQYFKANVGMLGLKRYYKAAASGAAVADSPSQYMTFTGRSLRPFAPAHVAATRDGADNITLTWERRTRALVDVFSTGRMPLLEEEESYEIDIMDGVTVLRTITATVKTAAYSAAEQTSDGLTPGDPVAVQVFQISAAVGRGYTNEETV
jgi:hypothetical protein